MRAKTTATRAMLVLGGALLAMVWMPFDTAAVAWIEGTRRPWMVGLADAVTEISKWHWLMLPFVAAAVWALRKGRHSAFGACCAAVIAGSAAGVVVNVFRPLFGRARPSAAVEQGWQGPFRDGALELFDARYHAFPSGHVAVAAAVGCALWVASGRRKVAWAWMLLPAAVGAARLVLLAHHPSDVLAGFALGCAVALGLAAIPVWPTGRRPYSASKRNTARPPWDR